MNKREQNDDDVIICRWRNEELWTLNCLNIKSSGVSNMSHRLTVR